MVEPTVSIYRAVATAAWSLAALLLLAAWIAFLVGHHHVPALLGLTAIGFVGVAAVLTIHGWVSRVCQVVKMTSGQRESAEVRSLR